MNEEIAPMKKGYIATLIREWFAERPHANPRDLYKPMGMSRHNFAGSQKEDREIGPRLWAKWRKGLGMSKSAFWKRAQEFYDP